MQNNNRSVFFPPIEADSLFLKVTTGCSYNKCSFCGTYKNILFRKRPFEAIEALNTAMMFIASF